MGSKGMTGTAWPRRRGANQQSAAAALAERDLIRLSRVMSFRILTSDEWCLSEEVHIMSTAGSAVPKHAGEQVGPMPLIETTFAMCQSSVLLAAVELNLFTTIDRGDDTVESVAEHTGCSVRGLRTIMDVLASMGFLKKDREHYSLSPVAAKFLSTDSPSYLGGFVLVHHSEAVYGKWHQLAQTVRSGQPPTTTAEENDRFFAQLVDPLYVLSLPAAEVAAKVICA